MAVVLVMMAVITGIVYFSVREYMLEEAQERYRGILLRTNEEFRRRLSDVYVAVKNNVHDIERDIDDPDMMYEHIKRFMVLNPTISFSALMFTPDYYPSQGEYFVPMGMRDSLGGVVVSRSEDLKGYNQALWYRRGMEADSGAWIGTHVDKTKISDRIRRHLQAMYATPIHDRTGKPVAMFSVEVSLKNIRRKMMEDITDINERFEKGRKYKSYCFVINHEGTYIIHPDKTRMLESSYLEHTKNTNDTLDDRVVTEMMKGYSGKAMLEVDGIPSWVYYRSIKYTDWTIAIVVPDDVLFYNGRMLNGLILAVVLLGLVAIYFICRRAIRNTTAYIERDLSIAHNIQMAMLPKPLIYDASPLISAFDLYASLTPAHEVGGDLYDYLVRDGRLYFCIGDVSGKGVPAALVMAVTRSLFHSISMSEHDPERVVWRINRAICDGNEVGVFVTMFVGVLDLSSGRLDYCNAGHEAPLILSEKSDVKCEKLPVKRNLPVGALSDWTFEGQQMQLNPGDVLFLYTDGLSEAKNRSGRQLGRQRVIQLAAEHISDTAQQLVQTMEQAVQHHAGGASQSDDITLLALKWNGSGHSPLASDLSMPAQMDDIARLKPYVESVAEQAGISSRETQRLRLAVEEAVANVVNYGQATAITLHAETADGQLLLTIDDDGLPFDPTKGSSTDLSVPPDQRPAGGMGIIMLHRMTEGLAYQRTDGHNILTLKKNITESK